MGKERKYQRVLVWMRRALRVQDNMALWHAHQDAIEVLPVVYLSSAARYALDTPRRRFITGSLFALDESLKSLGSQLVALEGDSADAIPRAAVKYRAQAVYAVSVYDPAAVRRDARIARELSRHGIEWSTFKDTVLFEKGEVLSAGGGPFKVYTPFKRACLEEAPSIPQPLPVLKKLTKPEIPPAVDLRKLAARFPRKDGYGGEQVAARRLRQFIQGGIALYEEQRDALAADGTSRLSPHLSTGTISIRQVYWASMDARANADRESRRNIDVFIGELLWREFYYQILQCFPHVAERSFRKEFDNLVWSQNRKHFARWCQGLTGYPIVDAGMRQLNSEGWMHNRARMIVASFLTKDLHINWQWGERYFFERLIDADIASNNGGWQWTAGTGTDASPWFRVFNPTTQGSKFDPDGEYVRRYVPELRHVPARYIHSPWTMTSSDQSRYKCVIGKDYPAPVVDHARERKVALALYRHPGQKAEKDAGS